MKNLFGEEINKSGRTKEEQKLYNQQNKWHKVFKKWLENEYDTKSELSGRLICGCDWLCDKCEYDGESQEIGIIPCKRTIIKLAKDYGITIDYNDFDFAKFENKVREKERENAKIS